MTFVIHEILILCGKKPADRMHLREILKGIALLSLLSTIQLSIPLLPNSFPSNYFLAYRRYY